MTFARNVALLNLLAASRPEIAALPLAIRVRRDGTVALDPPHQSREVPDIAARLAKALRAELQTYSGTSAGGERYDAYEVRGKFHSVAVDFYGYVYPDRKVAEGGEPE